MLTAGFLFYSFFLSLDLYSIQAEYVQDGVCVSDNKEGGVCDIYRQDYGAPIPSYTVSRTCGKDGPIVTEDTTFFKLLAAFVRERIPQRINAPKGTGAHGYFEVTHDITEYTKAAVFSHIGQKTPLFCRFSGSEADTLRVPHGFACKFYTTDGNWDLLTLGNLPVFNIRDPMLMVSSIHSLGQNPVTGRPDLNITWDFITKRQEQLNAFLHFFSDSGTPYGFRHMNGHAIHSYVFVNKQNKPTYVKFIWKTLQGIKNFTAEEAMAKVGENLDWSTKDLYDNIEARNCPRWTLCVQLMTFEQAQHLNLNPLDPTVPWFEDEIPCRPVGNMVLNQNPKNFFAEVEQSAFCPAHIVPGIEPSPDRVLQARIIVYDDAQRYRLGINSQQLPINRPRGVACCPHNLNRDGSMNYYNQESEPNYYPNSFSNLHPDPKSDFRNYKTDGEVGRHDLGDRPNYEQARKIYQKYSPQDRDHLAKNIASALQPVIKSIQCKAVKLFEGVSEQFAASVKRYANIECPKKNWDH